MDLKKRLESEMKQALRDRDALRLETVRGVRGAIRNKEIELGDELNDEGILRVIRGLVKQRVDSVEQYRLGGRSDLADKEAAEQAILEVYLPAAPDEAQVEAAVREAMAQLGAQGPKDMGRVMKAALERLGPAADGKRVSQIAKRLLSE
jgi:uncharacterized protein YqeY